jgi:hypothetical protein
MLPYRAMATISQLQRERRLPNDQLDEVIARASQLQEQARADNAQLTMSEVKAVGGELDIDPRFIEAAIVALERERAEAVGARERRRVFGRKLLLAGAALAVLALVPVWIAGGRVRAAAARAEAAEAALASVLDRQARLLPQLLALSGAGTADLSDLESHRQRVLNAREISERVVAAERLAGAMTNILVHMNTRPAPADSQMRLSLQHELVGAQNRITTEHRRYEESLTAWRAAAQSPLARVAAVLTLAPSPP